MVCSTITAGLLSRASTQPARHRPSAAIPICKPGQLPPAAVAGQPGSAASSGSTGGSRQLPPAQHQQQHGQFAGDASAGFMFDLVVVDEAGQALAPEVLLPLSLARPEVGWMWG